jgi:lactate dehydrogenase-like 2-hydroxyacid dehydrogenase
MSPFVSSRFVYASLLRSYHGEIVMNRESRPSVFVTRKIPATGLARLQRETDCGVWPGRMPPSRDDLLAGVKGCHGILSLLSDTIDGEVFDAAGPRLKVVSNFAVGVNNIDLAEAARRGILVGNTPDVLTDATADIAVALLLAAARHLQPAFDAVRDGDWRTWEPTGWLGCDLVGRTLGIVGMGRIGAAVARRMAGGWGMKVLYTARGEKQVDGVESARRVSLEELLSASDFVSLHTDLTEQTRGLIDAPRLALMKPTAILVNTSRGAVIDQDALVHALTIGRPMAAGLDVTDPEPLPPDHPLVGLSNCIILPHIGSATVASRDAMAEICVDNILAGLAGRPLRCPVV